MSKKAIHLAYAMYNHGTHPMGWTQAPKGVATDMATFTRAARIAEVAKLDMILRADNLYARMDNIEAWARNPLHMNSFEPLTLLAAVSQATTHIGLAATVSTTYTEPYNVARQLAALDHISGGRAAWNVVTSYSSEAARNFGQKSLPVHDERYGRAREHVEATKALWDTYEDDAFVHDTGSGYYFDPKKFHPVSFEGKYLSVNGALNIARPPQGYPVIMQAGGSPQGRQLAAETAELIFTDSRPREQAQAFYADIQKRVVAAGRDPGLVKILPGLTVVVGDTAEEARRKYAALEEQVPDVVKIQSLSEGLGTSLMGLPLDQPVPEELIPPATRGGAGGYQFVRELIESRITLREMLPNYRKVVGAGTPLCDTADKVADFMEEAVNEDACDGFVILVPSAPSAFELFCSTVVPELQRRNSFRREYSGRTLRDHFGLPRPPNQHVGR